MQIGYQSFGDCSISNPAAAKDTDFHNEKFFCLAGPFHVGVVVSTPGWVQILAETGCKKGARRFRFHLNRVIYLCF